MDEIKEYLPIIIPLVILEFALLGYALHHIFTHDKYKRGTRPLWVVICLAGMGFVGPIAYLLAGKEDN